MFQTVPGEALLSGQTLPFERTQSRTGSDGLAGISESTEVVPRQPNGRWITNAYHRLC